MLFWAKRRFLILHVLPNVSVNRVNSILPDLREFQFRAVNDWSYYWNRWQYISQSAGVRRAHKSFEPHSAFINKCRISLIFSFSTWELCMPVCHLVHCSIGLKGLKYWFESTLELEWNCMHPDCKSEVHTHYTITALAINVSKVYLFVFIVNIFQQLHNALCVSFWFWWHILWNL